MLEAAAESSTQAQEMAGNSEQDEGKEEKEPVAVERDEHGILHLTDENFSNFINNKEGILFVKFYAPW